MCLSSQLSSQTKVYGQVWASFILLDTLITMPMNRGIVLFLYLTAAEWLHETVGKKFRQLLTSKMLWVMGVSVCFSGHTCNKTQLRIAYDQQTLKIRSHFKTSMEEQIGFPMAMVPKSLSQATSSTAVEISLHGWHLLNPMDKAIWMERTTSPSKCGDRPLQWVVMVLGSTAWWKRTDSQVSCLMVQ